MLPLIPIAIKLASLFAPSLIGKLTKSDKAEAVAEKVIGFAQTITGQDNPEDAAKTIEANPELALQFQRDLHDYELGLEQERTKQLESVNRTMQAEAVSGSWAQRTWRPFNGFLLGITLFMDYIGSQIVLALAESTFVWQHIPAGVYMLWTGVLGIAAVSRGKEKVTKTKALALAEGIQLGNVDMLREFGKGIIGKVL